MLATAGDSITSSCPANNERRGVLLFCCGFHCKWLLLWVLLQKPAMQLLQQVCDCTFKSVLQQTVAGSGRA
jgi:hypothetical protein